MGGDNKTSKKAGEEVVEAATVRKDDDFDVTVGEAVDSPHYISAVSVYYNADTKVAHCKS